MRRNVALYGAAGELGIEDLALHWYERPGRALYSRVSLGYLERMFAGASAELLWKPVDSRLALGAELNYAVQRDYDLGFGAQDFVDLGGVYDVVTGHGSVYYDFENDFHGRIDVGRYLAGDWGATFALDREFANGWRVGAYATLTDVPFDDFGEGSFDKGIQLTIPVDWAIGTATRDRVDVRLSSLSRDGGARLKVNGRLYETVRSGHAAAISGKLGAFLEMRRLLLMTGLLAVTACGPLAQNQSSVSVLNGLASAGSDFLARERDPREALTRDLIESSPNDLLLFAPVNEDLASVFARVSRNGDLITWVSDKGYSLTLRAGVVIATRGLGNDLMGATSGQVYRTLVSGGGRIMRIHDYLDGEDQIVRTEYACEIETLRSEVIEIYQRQHRTRLVSETCTGDAGSFINLYWIDAAGTIWQSRQWVSPRVGAVDIQLL